MEKVYVLMFWAPVLWLCCVAEQQYFPQPNASTWEQSRYHCQVCYKELVTLTPNNIQIIVRNLSSDYWIGLRKKLNTTTGPNGTVPWSRWANGDPLTFQNWYPGRPMAKPQERPAPVFNLSDVCPTCECCCPSGCRDGIGDENLTAFTTMGDENLTVFTTMATVTTAMSMMTTTMFLNETDDASCEEDVYIEDPCVAMLSFGAWSEKNCSEHLPYICYEDRFYGNATVTNVTVNSGTLHWLPGPGDISMYRVEVRKSREQVKDDNLTQTLGASVLTYDLIDLTAGTLYLVQVFPVKCERDLNAENVTFYTKPEVVTNLRVTSVTENSALLSWSPPRGNRDLYYIEVRDEPNLNTTSSTEEVEVTGLIPGGRYTFDVIAGAGTRDQSEGVKSMEGEAVSIPAYTMPSTVSNLNVVENLKNSLLLSWHPAEGNLTGYRVTACYNQTVTSVNCSINLIPDQTTQNVTGLPAGTRVLLSVVALANGTLEGDPVTEFGYTAPNPVEGLHLLPTANSLNASWNPPGGNYESFTVVLSGHGGIKHLEDVQETHVNFTSLNAAANYTVTVRTVNGHLKSEAKTSSKFTLPVEPQNANIKFHNKTNIVLEWVAPPGTLYVTYRVTYRASFWGEEANRTVVSDTMSVFEGLHTGTKYDFEVRTLAGELESRAATASVYTDPEEKVLTLSLQCSTTEPLDCEKGNVPTKIFDKLVEYFENKLTTAVFWKLKWKEG